jgi:hypothetical protein
VSDLTERLSAELPADARMDGYYFWFDRTGVGAIDAILSAIGRAGKAYHSTEFWGDDDPYGPAPGMSYIDLIQQAANEAAALIREAAERLSKIDGTS